MKRVAVIGGGISGLGAAWHLADEARVTLFEAAPTFGGHAHTVDVTLDGVDTGFLVFNHRTYPNLKRLFQTLGVATAASDMSFSVQVPQDGLEWSGCSLNTVFAQRRNLLRPRFLRMLADIVRFNRLATSEARAMERGEPGSDEPIGDWLTRHRFGNTFREWYFLPMVGCIWSCPIDQMLRFPIATMLRFCHNHGLLQVADRPQWYTVRGGSRHYVNKMLKRVPDARAATPVRALRREGAHWRVATDGGSEVFDQVVLACHSDQAHELLPTVCTAQRELLASIRYQPNRAVLHTDRTLLPARESAWAAWNYARAADAGREQAQVCLHYLINRLQPLPWRRPVVVSLNPDPKRLPDPRQVLGEFEWSHPVFDLAAIAAQQRLPSIQGAGGLWFCGAWARYGFHEDGLSSALNVVDGLRRQWRDGSANEQAAA